MKENSDSESNEENSNYNNNNINNKFSENFSENNENNNENNSENNENNSENYENNNENNLISSKILQNECSYTTTTINSINQLKNFNFSSALEGFKNSLKIANELNDEYKKNESLCNLGIANFYLNKINESINYLENSYKNIKTKCSNENFANDLKSLNLLIKTGVNLILGYLAIGNFNEISEILNEVLTLIEREVSYHKQLKCVKMMIKIFFHCESLIENEEENENEEDENKDYEKYKNIIKKLNVNFNEFLKNKNYDEFIKCLSEIKNEFEKLNDFTGILFAIFNEQAFIYVNEMNKDENSEKINDCKGILISLFTGINKNDDENKIDDNLFEMIFKNFKEKIEKSFEIYQKLFEFENKLVTTLNNNNNVTPNISPRNSKINNVKIHINNNNVNNNFFIKLLINYYIVHIIPKISNNNNNKNLLIEQLKTTLNIIENSNEFKNISIKNLDNEIFENLFILFDNLLKIHIKFKKKHYLNIYKHKIFVIISTINVKKIKDFYDSFLVFIDKGEKIIKINFNGNGFKEHFYRIDINNDNFEIYKNSENKKKGKANQIINMNEILKIVYGFKTKNLKKKYENLENNLNPELYLSLVCTKRSYDFYFKKEKKSISWFYGFQIYYKQSKRNYKVSSTTKYVLSRLKIKMAFIFDVKMKSTEKINFVNIFLQYFKKNMNNNK